MVGNICKKLKVLSYWNLNAKDPINHSIKIGLKVLSYWNLNIFSNDNKKVTYILKVLSYWNLNAKLFIKFIAVFP